jgi:hypothetical protein
MAQALSASMRDEAANLPELEHGGLGYVSDT